MRVEAFRQAHRGLVVAAAAVVPFAACALLAVFRESVANTNAALGLVLLVVAAASTGIRWAGIVAALSSAAWFDFFLTEPYNQFTIADRADIETAVLLLIVGTAVTEIALWGRRQQARASREQGYLDGVVGTAATVAAGWSPPVRSSRTSRSRSSRYCRSTTAASTPATASALAALETDGTVSRNGRPVDVDRLGLPTDSEIALVVQSAGVSMVDSCSSQRARSSGRRWSSDASRCAGKPGGRRARRLQQRSG